ncbi:hypothetical protein QAD02_005302 [Eretmocerus hayati]|uniref:Uncharacterized protein n=1 Tax=Eretmocerus hayati TaxID=131215 RepID=A0ACC2NWX4_9HYME|nr:hypothetical protein QAD02_005302 [Eretmocerus hayati]
MRFSEGDSVLAKAPNSDDFEKATVIDIRGNKYRLKFKGGVERSLGEGDVKAQRTSRSQTRTSKSRSSEKSKSRTRKSPSRKSPARKSPARSPDKSRKLSVRNARQAKISLARLDIGKDNSSDTDRTEGSESVQDEYEPPKSRGPRGATRRSIRIMASESKAARDAKLAELRGADRAASLPVERKNQYKGSDGRGYSVLRDEDLKKINYESDNDMEPLDNKSKDVDLNKPQEWGGWLGALLLILSSPVFTLAIQLACSNGHCSSKNFRIPKYRDWRLFVNLEAFLAYGGFLLFVAVLSALPIGKRIDGQQTRSGRLQYRLTGIWILLLSLIIFIGGTYRGYNIADFLLKKSLTLSTTALAFGALLALILYIKGGRVPVSDLNLYGSTNSAIFNFWQGREISPRFGPLDVKLVLFRTGLIGSILINVAALAKIYKESGGSLDLNTLNIHAVLIALFGAIYFTDTILFESKMLTTFEITSEGTGYMSCFGYLIYPYLSTLPLRYVLLHKPRQPLYFLGIFAVSYLIGYIILRKSNSQKNEFRRNPFAPSVSHLETIPTKRGQRLIVSGLWGHVRHPNYLGDILINWSIACLTFSTDVLPYVLPISLTLWLIYRAVRDNARCAKRYGYAWEQYCSRVRYMILNRVF